MSIAEKLVTIAENSKKIFEVGKNTPADTYILVDTTGKEIVGTLVNNETVFTATANDIREGMIAATDSGVTTGSKVIPSYHTTETTRYIPVGSAVTIPLPILDKYDYTKLQVVICEYNTSMSKSVSVIKTAILNKVYDVNSVTEIAEVKKDSVNKTIDLGITNDTEKPFVIRCFTYKEIE